MRYLAGAGHVPAVTVVAGAAVWTDTNPARVIYNHLFQAVRAAVLDNTGQVNILSLDSLSAGE